MPEKSGILAVAAMGTTRCAEAGITAAAIVINKRYCCALTSTSPSWFAELRALVLYEPGDVLRKVPQVRHALSALI